MKLLTNENNANTLKILIASKISQKKLDICLDSVENLNLKFPATVPQLVLSSGAHIFSSNASVKYLCPPTQQEADIVNDYLDLEAAVIRPRAVLFYNSKVNDQSKKSFEDVLKYLDQTLSSVAFLAGDKITAADIAIWCTIYPLITDSKLSKDLFNGKPSLKKWFDNVHTLPSVQDALKTYSVKEDAVPFGKAAQSIKTVTTTTKITGPGSTSLQKVTSSSTQQEIEPTKEPGIVVSKEEKEAAMSAWQEKPKTTFKPAVRPVLPVPGERNILITSALPYVNNVPHLGNIIGCVLSGDVFARYCRLRGYNTLYVCGTDEYGTATETKALEEGLTPQEICDKYFQIHDAIYKWFDISFDHFGRTTTSHQTEICQDIFKKVYNNGFVLAESVEQLLCEKCDRYLADRFVEGTCPRCAYEDARGDQCDGCGHLINAPELIKPRCKMCKATPVLRQSQQFFLDLPKIEPTLKEWIQKSSLNWSHNAREISKAWLNDGLKPRCITRDLKWGIPVPLDGYRNKVFYVWFDAPIGYISITKLYTENWKKWWMPDKGTDVRLYQFMAKDNVPFHSVMFPASLLATKENFVLVNNIYATEYLNYEDGKFSKSRGVGVFGNDAQDTGIPADVWRFYLLYVRPESQDSSFSWVDLALKNNSELLNILGNFINRALVFCEKNHSSTVPEIHLTEEDHELLALVNRELTEYISALEKGKLRDGIRHTLSIARLGNQLMQASQPWVLCKGTDDEKRRCGTVIGLSINLSCLLSQLLYPYMPSTSEVIREQLNSPPEVNFIDDKFRLLLPPGHQIGKPFPLFHKIEVDHIEKLKSKFGGRQKSSSPPSGGDSGKKGSINNNLSHGEDVASLEAAVAAQGDLVRKMKSAGKEKSEWQPQVAILLDLKKKLAEAQAKAKESTPVSATSSSSGKSVQALEEEVKKQGDHVRKLKESGAARSQWQPEVNILLDLKKQLAEAQEKAKESTPASVSTSATTNVTSSPPTSILSSTSEKSVEELEEEVKKQGDHVRKLKGSGVDRSQWQPEVNILLDLKKKLAEAQAKAKESTPVSVNSSATANVISSPPDSTPNSTSEKSVEVLEQEVMKQGDVVRKLKESGADRSLWQPELNILLDLKKQLAELKGEPLPTSSSKKNKKK